jgi:hypothetical protein
MTKIKESGANELNGDNKEVNNRLLCLDIRIAAWSNKIVNFNFV